LPRLLPAPWKGFCQTPEAADAAKALGREALARSLDEEAAAYETAPKVRARDVYMEISDAANNGLSERQTERKVASIYGLTLKEFRFAGGVPGHADGPRLLAQFDSNFYINSFLPRYLGGDNLGNLFVSDRNWIRKIDTNGLVSTLATVSRLGTSAPPPFGFAMGVCVDNAGNVYVSDILNHTIRKLSPDADFDGIPDTEEGGMTPFVPGRDDRQIDSDGDEMRDAAEYIAGTDPTDKNSVLRLQVSLRESSHITISWTGVLGRTYRPQSSNDLENWTDLVAELHGTGNAMSAEDSASNNRFYRLSVDLQ
jgi:hypothetical protein